MVLRTMFAGLFRWATRATKTIVLWPLGLLKRVTKAILSTWRLWTKDLTKSTVIALAIVVSLIVGIASLGIGLAVAALWLVLALRSRWSEE